jgi:hypothetical protein
MICAIKVKTAARHALRLARAVSYVEAAQAEPRKSGDRKPSTPLVPEVI